MKLKAALLFLLVTTSLVDAQDYNRLDAKENHAPVFVTEMPDTVIQDGKAYRFFYKAEDLDGDKIKYGSLKALPTGAIINDSTGLFTWKPTARQGGKHEIVITASDGKSIANSRTTKLVVMVAMIYDTEIKLSVSPSIGGTTISNSYLCNVEDTITIKAYSNTGYRFMSWTENDSVVSRDSFYTFIVTKNRNLVANFRINRAPVFVTEMPDTSILAGRTLPFTYKAIDPDGDSIKYSIYSKSELLMHIDSTTGFFVCRGQHVQIGNNYDLIIAATDGILTTLSKKTIISVYIIPSVESEILPTEFNLSQNFPNPFNPETTIQYSLPKSEHVTLKVFDVLGREVATPVNEHKQPGAYKTNFNATGLTSGVYFYQLQAGAYVETKKLIILR